MLIDAGFGQSRLRIDFLLLCHSEAGNTLDSVETRHADISNCFLNVRDDLTQQVDPTQGSIERSDRVSIRTHETDRVACPVLLFTGVQIRCFFSLEKLYPLFHLIFSLLETIAD